MDIITLTLWIVAGTAMLVGAGLGLIHWIRLRRHQIKAEVYELDNLGRVIPYYDKFGIILNKEKGEKMGHLLRSNVWCGLANENYQTIKVKKLIGWKHFKVARLLRSSEDNIGFLTPEIVDAEGDKLKNLKLQVNPEDTGWATFSYLKWTRTFAKQSRIKELMTIGLMIIALVFVLVVAVMLIKEIPNLSQALETTSGNIATAAESIKNSVAMQQGVIQ